MKTSPIKTFVYYFLQFTWGIIQNIIGLLLWLLLLIKNPKRKISRFNEALVTSWNIKYSLGLGMFIFMGVDNKQLLVHEYGHTIQSMILGPLFIPLVGIPSFLWATLSINRKIRRNRNINYYNFYTEKWANSLGSKKTGLKAKEK